MNPKTKKVLIIAGIALDMIVTVLLFVFSIVLINNIPASKSDVQDPSTFIGWFQADPIRILLIDVAPLALLLVLNVFLTFRFFKKNGGDSGKKKNVTLDDLSDEEKEALRKKILQEMLDESSKK